ncbi:hypothetical protein AAG747_09940 [Rapidithrix thailandica]|uniref:DUF4340 domain-containing protein n=1 Tax=Rapidithrix thailandica TaxID=413964 RepID=A0AAW9SBE6_9BACT
MTSKIKILIIINILLLAGVFLSLIQTEEQSSVQVEGQLFVVNDTAHIQRIEVGTHELTRQGDQNWKLNGRYTVAPQAIQTLLTVMQNMEVKRPVTEENISGVNQEFNKKGINVKVFGAEGVMKRYSLYGDSVNTYAKVPGEAPYLVYVPGYFINLDKLYRINEREWRDKRVLYTTFRTMKNLQVDYPVSPDKSFQIAFDSSFYKVSGVQKLDSAAVYNYISMFGNLAANDYLENTSLRDSLAKQVPFCVITMKDLYEKRNNTVRFYPGPQVVYGLSENTKEVVLFDPRRIQTAFVSREAFMRKEKSK